MSAPLKNQFWKIRTKHGRDKIFSDPQTMLLAAYEYFKWNSENPWYKNEAIKSGDSAGKIVAIPTERPLTLEGLTQFLGVNRKYFDNFETSLSPNEQDFSPVIAHIREVISRQKIEGATIGAYNANIVARIEGLTEKVKTEGTNVNYNAEVSKDEAATILEAIKAKIQ